MGIVIRTFIVYFLYVTFLPYTSEYDSCEAMIDNKSLDYLNGVSGNWTDFQKSIPVPQSNTTTNSICITLSSFRLILNFIRTFHLDFRAFILSYSITKLICINFRVCRWMYTSYQFNFNHNCSTPSTKCNQCMGITQGISHTQKKVRSDWMTINFPIQSSIWGKSHFHMSYMNKLRDRTQLILTNNEWLKLAHLTSGFQWTYSYYIRLLSVAIGRDRGILTREISQAYYLVYNLLCKLPGAGICKGFSCAQ